MTSCGTQISNPFSSGGGGVAFEIQVQASFVALMLVDGYSPCLPCQPIQKIKLQGRIAGFKTDDMIVFTGSGEDERKLLGQMKHSISITEGDATFKDVISSAWVDFNNSQVFRRNRDVIALITGPLNASDTNDVRFILEWARSIESEDEFMRNINTTRFSSGAKQAKLNAFRKHLESANGEAVTDQELFQFLRHFHLLGYDLDIRSGVMHALLHSIISRRNSSVNPAAIFSQIAQEVSYLNQSAGTVTKTSLPEDIRKAFEIVEVETIPAAVAATIPPRVIIDWNTSEFADSLVIANLLGAWNEHCEADIEIIQQLLDSSFDVWQAKIRQVVQLENSPLSVRNGIWRINNRVQLWETLGSCLFDGHLSRFRECVLEVLKERDPQFEIEPGERYAANMYGKVLKYSEHLRKGVAETLAVLGSMPEVFSNCSQEKLGAVPVLTLRELFDNADWVVWGSLNHLLPVLAEASPRDFLGAVENAIQLSPCPFDELFSQEGSGFTGRNHMTGLLWALEGIAWDPDCLVQATVLLGALANRDPGGQWGNRPANSLATIYLPWLPQTIASLEKREVALRTLLREFPDVVWKLLISLLPDQMRTSSHTHKPTWRKTIPGDWQPGVTQQEYQKQVTVYSQLAEQVAVGDLLKLMQLAENLDHLPRSTFEMVLVDIGSDAVVNAAEENRYSIWNTLVKFVSKHRRYSETDWAMPEDMVHKIEKVAEKIKPTRPEFVHGRLFSGRDWDLYDGSDNWQEQEAQLEQRRQMVINGIFKSDGFEAVIHLAESVESARQVGTAFSNVAPTECDATILPSMLGTDTESHSAFLQGFVWGRLHYNDWKWVESVIDDCWTQDDIMQFLTLLPFRNETWQLAARLLESDCGYWADVTVNPYQSDDNLDYAIEHLIENERPWAALDCLAKQVLGKVRLDSTMAVKALLNAAASVSERRDTNDVALVIKALQANDIVTEEQLFKVEWMWLPLLSGESKVRPKTLESNLVSNPAFFIELLRLVYRSDNDAEEPEDLPETEQARVMNAWRLLDEWKTLPGFSDTNQFSEKEFKGWVQTALHMAAESGHTKHALRHIGSVLYNSPEDPSGLWIHTAVAEVLNAPDHDKMRQGYRLKVYNARGVHWVDPTGNEELKLAAKYRQQAENVENAGYQRFAGTLRELAESYEYEAKRVVDDHKDDLDDDSI